MKIDYRYRAVSGLSRELVYAIGYRFDPADERDPDVQESYVIRLSASASASVMFGDVCWLTDVWVGPSGHVYVTDADGILWHHADPRADTLWSSVELDMTPIGVFGFDDANVFCWGANGEMFRFDGTSVHEVPYPGSRIESMHGPSPAQFVVAGEEILALWEGGRWRRLEPGAGEWTDVHYVNEHELYLVGFHGELHDGSIYAVERRAGGEDLGMLERVTKRDGVVWVGSGDSGLYALRGDELVLEQPDLKVIDMDARGELVLLTEEGVHVTADGSDFLTFGLDAFAVPLKGRRPKWIEADREVELDDRAAALETAE